MKKSSILKYTSKFINKNFRLKVYGVDGEGNRINKLVGVAGLPLSVLSCSTSSSTVR